MKVQLIDVDSRMPNLALMKLSAWHKKKGDTIVLTNYNKRRMGQVAYASCLFKWNKSKIKRWMIGGGPGYEPGVFLPDEIDKTFPDYSLYKNNISSLGYTFKGCPRKCSWCVVKDQKHGCDYSHYSIYEFLDRRYKEISLLNNNTFFDPLWRETFKEIWKENLKLRDHNGYDIRLMDEEKLWYLERTKWGTLLHFAWDSMKDSKDIEVGLEVIKGTSMKRTICFYVMVGYNTTEEEDLYRIETISKKYGFMVWIMPYKRKDGYCQKLSGWVNNRRTFYSCGWGDYESRDGEKRRKKRNDKAKVRRTKRVHRRSFESFNYS